MLFSCPNQYIKKNKKNTKKVCSDKTYHRRYMASRTPLFRSCLGQVHPRAAILKRRQQLWRPEHFAYFTWCVFNDRFCSSLVSYRDTKQWPDQWEVLGIELPTLWLEGESPVKEQNLRQHVRVKENLKSSHSYNMPLCLKVQFTPVSKIHTYVSSSLQSCFSHPHFSKFKDIGRGDVCPLSNIM